MLLFDGLVSCLRTYRARELRELIAELAGSEYLWEVGERSGTFCSLPVIHLIGYLRTLMVQGAHHILGLFGQDSDLRRWGLKLAERGGKNAKKRAVVAVARKLSVLLHKLWVSGEVYEALRNNHKVASAAA